MANSTTWITRTFIWTAAFTAAGAAYGNPPTPILQGSLHNNDTTVEGYYSPPASGVASIAILVNEKEAAQQSANLDEDTGKFVVTLLQKLSRGQKVQARLDVKSAGEVHSSDLSAAKDVGDTRGSYDWGRVRSDFTFGAIASKEREDFSETDAYLGLGMSYTWRQTYSAEVAEKVEAVKGARLIGMGIDCPEGLAREVGTDCEQRKFHYLLQSFLDLRLTSIPVVSGENGGNDGGGNGSGDNEGQGDSSNLTGERPPSAFQNSGDKTDPLDAFLASQKSVAFQFGMVAPLFHNSMTWDFGGDKHSLYFGPVVKVGFDSVREETKTIRQDPDDLFESYSAGVRIGHMKLNADKAQAPRTVSFLDITRGKFENFEACRDGNRRVLEIEQGGTCDAAGGELLSPWRWGIEGRLRIPETPLLLGFQLNSGRDEDDIRFIVGATFDIGKVFTKLSVQ